LPLNELKIENKISAILLFKQQLNPLPAIPKIYLDYHTQSLVSNFEKLKTS
jgi:hypothetical protein